MPDDLEAKRQTATYARTVAWLRHTAPETPDDEMDRIALQKVDEGVFGVGAKRNAKGELQQMGIGSPGNESGNHFAAILKYQGRDAHEKAVHEIWKRDPKRAAALGLPQPART
jgi:hypothetical protein